MRTIRSRCRVYLCAHELRYGSDHLVEVPVKGQFGWFLRFLPPKEAKWRDSGEEKGERSGAV